MRLFQQNKEAQKAFEKIVKHIDEKQMCRGDTLTYETIASVTGFTREHRGWQTLSNKLRRFKLKDSDGIWLKAVPNVGYLLCDAGTQLDQFNYHGKKAARQFKKARAKVEALPMNILSENQRMMQSKIVEVSRTQANAAHRVTRLIHRGNSKP